VTPGWTVLKPEMAACWKLVWNVEPLALIVPLTAAELEEELAAEDAAAGADAGAELDDELDEEHAARASAATTAPPATAACLLPRSCIYSPCN
jgi:hypothetical protein